MAEKVSNARITTRILVVFGLTFLAIFGLMQMQGLLVSAPYYQIARNTGFVLMLVFGGLAALSLLVSALLTARKNAKARLFWGITFILAVLGGCMLTLHLTYIDHVQTLNIGLIALAVLYLLYLIFPREFFTQALCCALCAAGLFVVSRLSGRGQLLLVCLGLAGMALLLCAMAFWALPRAQADKGRLRLLGRTVALATPKAGYDAFKITFFMLALGILAAAVCCVIGPMTGYFGVFWVMLAVFGYLFVLAVYYTVKIM